MSCIPVPKIVQADEFLFRGVPPNVSAARRCVAQFLGPAHPALETALLLTSELVTNAIRHTASGENGVFTLLLYEEGGRVTIEVADQGSRYTAPHVVSDPDDEHGRGLMIVKTYAASWGIRNLVGGRIVWCEIAS